MVIDAREKRGMVKWFNPTKGFGFVVPEEPGPELFVHYTSIMTFAEEPQTLHAGQEIRYLLGHDAKGRPQAKQVVPVESDGPYR